MIGTVLWSDAAAKLAVLKCEDRGPHAFLRGTEGLASGMAFPAAGDILWISTHDCGASRLVDAAREATEGDTPFLPVLKHLTGRKPMP